MTDSLFTKGGTCVGYYRPNAKSVTLLNLHKEKIGVVTNRGVVAKASKVNDKWWYSYGDIKEIGAWDSLVKQDDDVKRVLSKCGIDYIY